MPTYRFYGINPSNRIASSPQHWDGADDWAAHEYGRTIIGDHSGMEIWEGPRLVGRVFRKPASQPLEQFGAGDAASVP